jgi:predicted TIM-barrel fold metal-dependent hydrolase
MTEYVVGKVDEFVSGKAVAVQAGRRTIAVFPRRRRFLRHQQCLPAQGRLALRRRGVGRGTRGARSLAPLELAPRWRQARKRSTPGGGGNYEPIGTARHDPIFDAAVEHDLVVTSHIGMFWQKASPLSEGTRTWTELVGISAVCTGMAYVGSMIMQDLFDKYPTLRMIIKEGGFWWLPEFMARTDDYYLSHPGDIKLVERKLESGEKFLAKLPSEYFESNIRFSSQPMCFPKNSEHFKALMTLCRGEDWLLYSSDWPHATFDPLNWVFNGVISEEGRRKILSENARGWIRRLTL